jgi:cation transport ATPase
MTPRDTNGAPDVHPGLLRSTESPDPAEALLDRPLSDRIREFKYRFAQAAVFGLPVLALQYLGPHLGGAESTRWIGLFQALLAGWVLYVSSGVLFEGLIHLLHRNRPTLDLLVILLALPLYLASLATWIIGLTGRSLFRPVFHWPVLLILAWAGLRWAQLHRRRQSREPYTPPAPPG